MKTVSLALAVLLGTAGPLLANGSNSDTSAGSSRSDRQSASRDSATSSDGQTLGSRNNIAAGMNSTSTMTDEHATHGTDAQNSRYSSATANSENNGR